MKRAEGFRSTELSAAFERALTGNRAELLRQLELQSGLPGPRINLPLALAFAHECVRAGASADPLIEILVKLEPNEARGASGKEFLSVCGVLALGQRAASVREPKMFANALRLLEEKADDLRFHVRDAVPLALASIGSVLKRDLCTHLEPWMDRYFHAGAVLLALAQPTWLETFGPDDHAPIVALFEAAFTLAHDAPRSAFRYPGHKALLDALCVAPKAVARRCSQAMFDLYARWARAVKVPELRDAILANLSDTQQKKAFGEQMVHIKALVEQSKPPPRDPTILRHGTRGRGKKRSRM
jgi:hypothetical protein